MDKKTLPYNCPLLAEWFEDFSYIRNYFTRLGGLPYEILKNSGLDTLEIFGFLDNNDWEDTDSIKEKLSGNRIIALEVYAKTDSEFQKAYLYADSINSYYSVYQDGEVCNGKLVLTKERLEKWKQRGYFCIFPQEESTQEVAESIYSEVWKEELLIRNIKPWSGSRTAASNGYKTVFLILNYRVEEREDEVLPFTMEIPEDYVFEVDYYAINTCFTMLAKERYIRQMINPFFLISRIDTWDLEVAHLLRAETKDVFLREMGYDIEEFPNCYQKLAYITAYFSYYYPELEEKMKAPLAKTDGIAIGISMEDYCCYAANALSDGTVNLIRNPKLSSSVAAASCDYEPEDIYSFDVNCFLQNAGVALSELGVFIRSLFQTNIYRDVKRVGICIPSDIPQKEAIRHFMHDYEAGSKYFPERKPEIMIYHELGLEEMDGIDIIKNAAKLAGADEVILYGRAVAVVAGYEAVNPDNALGDFENTLVYDWGEERVEVSIVDRGQHRTFVFYWDCIDNPINEDDWEEDVSTIYDELCVQMRSRMLEQEDFLKLMKLDESNEEAWKKLYDSVGRALFQFKRENNATLVLENAWARVEEELPYAEFKEIFRPYYEKTESLIDRVLQHSYFDKESISKVFVSGEWGNYPYVWDRLEEYFGKGKVCVMADTSKAAVLGAAYLAGKQKE